LVFPRTALPGLDGRPRISPCCQLPLLPNRRAPARARQRTRRT